MELFSFGPLLARTRFAFLPQLADCERTLILGDGDGRFTATLLQQNPKVHVTAVDASQSMLAELARRCNSENSRLELVHADAREPLPSGGQWQAIVTHFFLDCLSAEEVRILIERVTAQSSPKAKWVLSEFSAPANGPMRWPAKLLIAVLYRSFALLTGLKILQIPPYGELLQTAGWHKIAEQRLLGGILLAQCWQLNHEI